MKACNFFWNECDKNKLLKHFKDIIVCIFYLLSSLEDWKCFKNDINIKALLFFSFFSSQFCGFKSLIFFFIFWTKFVEQKLKKQFIILG